MILDKEDQRILILQLINTATITGQYIDMVLELRESVKQARLLNEAEVMEKDASISATT